MFVGFFYEIFGSNSVTHLGEVVTHKRTITNLRINRNPTVLYSTK